MTNQEYYEELCEKAKKYDLLQQEKGKLQKIILKYEDIFVKQQAEIGRLNNNISAMATTLSNSAKATRNEAIKEFAGKLVDVFYSHDKGDTYVREVVYNLVKEMVGDDK